jgi:hypothetical protein
VSNEEVRTVSATGGEKGRKTAELASIDPLALLTLAEVSGFGARKYDSFNYLKGYDWTLSANAALRHLLAFLNGEDNDPESGLPHTAHFAWHGLALTSFLQRGLGTDDRYKQPTSDKRATGGVVRAAVPAVAVEDFYRKLSEEARKGTLRHDRPV